MIGIFHEVKVYAHKKIIWFGRIANKKNWAQLDNHPQKYWEKVVSTPLF